MTTLQSRNPSVRAGASWKAAGERVSRPDDGTHMARLQYRLSSFALALEAVLPDLALMETAVQQVRLGLPLSTDTVRRLDRLALKLFDLRAVLEWPLPEVRR